MVLFLSELALKNYHSINSKKNECCMRILLLIFVVCLLISCSPNKPLDITDEKILETNFRRMSSQLRDFEEAGSLLNLDGSVVSVGNPKILISAEPEHSDASRFGLLFVYRVESQYLGFMVDESAPSKLFYVHGADAERIEHENEMFRSSIDSYIHKKYYLFSLYK